jgi:ribosome-associated toxin RatA of RatAB toxin-antitoxin module
MDESDYNRMRMPTFPPLLPRLKHALWAAVITGSLAMLATAAPADEDSSFSVHAQRHGDAVQIDAYANVHAPFELIRSTLTDYDHLADFVPGMKSSHVLEQHGHTSLVEQSGYAHLWFLKFPIDVTVQALDRSPSRIEVHLVKGNLRQLDGSYDIEKIGIDNSYALHWTGIIEPGTNVPGAIAVPLLRRNISEQFRGMVNEIERRAALASAAHQE